MIDDRNETPSSYEIMDLRIWDRESNVEAWQRCLGGSQRMATWHLHGLKT